MRNTLDFTDAELAILHLLLSQELESSRVELHHTAGFPYREYIKRRMEQGKALLTKMDGASTFRCTPEEAETAGPSCAQARACQTDLYPEVPAAAV